MISSNAATPSKVTKVLTNTTLVYSQRVNGETSNGVATGGQSAITGGFAISSEAARQLLNQRQGQLSATMTKHMNSQADPKAAAVRDAELSHKMATGSWNTLMDKTAELPTEDKAAAGKHIFYNLASSSGEYKNQDGTPMTPEQVRNVFDGYDQPAKDAASARVMDYGQQNPEMLNLSIGDGYASWAVSHAQSFESREAAGKPVSLDEANRTLSIFQAGSDYSKHRSGYLGHLHTLYKMGEKDTVNQLTERLDGSN